jgi:hypothetical protein
MAVCGVGRFGGAQSAGGKGWVLCARPRAALYRACRSGAGHHLAGFSAEFMAPQVGLEPTTSRLQGGRSTN